MKFHRIIKFYEKSRDSENITNLPEKIGLTIAHRLRSKQEFDVFDGQESTVSATPATHGFLSEYCCPAALPCVGSDV